MSDQATARARAIAKFAEQQRADYPYVLRWDRRGGHNSGVGLQLGSRVARSHEDAEAQQRQMEIVDAVYGHTTTYEIEERAAAWHPVGGQVADGRVR